MTDANHSANLFLIGAPKCGTTTVTDWLIHHPDVFVPTNRENHFFAPDVRPGRAYRTDAAYEALYHGASTHRYRFDGSTGYLFSQVAVPTILQKVTAPKFIVCLRDPRDMAPSLHRERYNAGEETEANFWKAWIRGNSRPNLPAALNYPAQCRLGEQVERLLDHVDESQVHFILLDDIRTSPAETFAALLHFLELPLVSPPDFRVVGAGFERRSIAIQRAIHVLHQLRRRLGIGYIGTGLTRRLDLLNRRDLVRRGLPAHQMEQLTRELRADVERLERMIGRDLSSWTKLPANTAA